MAIASRRRAIGVLLGALLASNAYLAYRLLAPNEVRKTCANCYAVDLGLAELRATNAQLVALLRQQWIGKSAAEVRPVLASTCALIDSSPNRIRACDFELTLDAAGRVTEVQIR
jgi:hypothetical protein